MGTKIRYNQVADLDLTTNKELGSGYKTDVLDPNVYPLTVTSTGTDTFDITGADLTTLRIEQDDVVRIAGGNAAGDYRVKAVIDANTLRVQSTVPSATSGGLTIYHYPGAERVGVNDTALTSLSGTTVQAVLESIDTNALLVGASAGGDLGGTYPNPTVTDNTSVQQVNVEKNGALIGTRSTLNFVAGTNISLSMADDATNDEVDIQINASSGIDVQEPGGTTVTGATEIEFVEGSNINLVVQNPSAGVARVTPSAVIPAHTHSHVIPHYSAMMDGDHIISAGNAGIVEYDLDNVKTIPGVALVSAGVIDFQTDGVFAIDADVSMQIDDGTGDATIVELGLLKNTAMVTGSPVIHEWGDRSGSGGAIGMYQHVSLSRTIVSISSGDQIKVRLAEVSATANIRVLGGEQSSVTVTQLSTEVVTP